MNKLENLIEIIDCKYPHIHINDYDLYTLTRMPKMKRLFYPFHHRYAYPKHGAFNNGQTIVWATWDMPEGHIRISTKLPKDLFDTSWTDKFSFKEEDDPMRIYKHIKMKAFW